MSHFFYPNVQFAKKAMPDRDFDELQEYIIGDHKKIPTYNFLKKGEVPTNKIEKAIVKMLGGQNHHIEYWVRCNDAPIWHVDGEEITQKNDPAYTTHYGEKGPTYEQELSHTSYVLYMKVELLYGGEFYVLPYNTYVKGRPILDESYQPPPDAKVIKFFPRENTCIKMTNNPYHMVDRIHQGFRLVLVFALWDHVPKGFKEHNHWMGLQHDKVVPMRWPLKE